MATISSLTHFLAFLLGLALATLTTETNSHLRNLLDSLRKILSSDSKDISRSRLLSTKTASVTPPDFRAGGDVILSRYLVTKFSSPAWLTMTSGIRSKQHMDQRHGSARLTTHSFALCWKSHPCSPVFTRPKATKPTNSDSFFSRVKTSRHHPTSPHLHPLLSPTCPNLTT